MVFHLKIALDDNPGEVLRFLSRKVAGNGRLGLVRRQFVPLGGIQAQFGQWKGVHRLEEGRAGDERGRFRRNGAGSCGRR
jgi:hypothetical protein